MALIKTNETIWMAKSQGELCPTELDKITFREQSFHHQYWMEEMGLI